MARRQLRGAATTGGTRGRCGSATCWRRWTPCTSTSTTTQATNLHVAGTIGTTGAPRGCTVCARCQRKHSVQWQCTNPGQIQSAGGGGSGEPDEGDWSGAFQNALLSLAAMHAHFGHTTQALTALNETVRSRRLMPHPCVKFERLQPRWAAKRCSTGAHCADATALLDTMDPHCVDLRVCLCIHNVTCT